MRHRISFKIFKYKFGLRPPMEPLHLCGIFLLLIFFLFNNQIPYIEEEQTAQWPKEKVQQDKQRSAKHAYKTKDRNII